MKATHRILCLLLVVCFAVVALTACGTDTDPSANSSVPAGTNSNTSGGDDKPTFRLEKKDFGGTEIKVLTVANTDYYKSEIAPEESKDNEPVIDAFYNRAQLIEQEYGIKLVQEYADSQGDLVTTAREFISSNMDEYQLYCGGLIYLGTLCREDLFIDLNTITQNDYLDLNQPYWDQSIKRDLSVMGKTYFATGDALVTDDESTWAIYFNKEIAANNNLAANYDVDSLYDLVNDNRWTIDVMYEMAKTATAESGDSVMEFSPSTSDVWGITGQCYDSYAFMVGAGQSLTRSENGKPVITIGDASNLAAYDKIFTMLNDQAYVAIAEKNGRGMANMYDIGMQIFANGKSLFMPNKIEAVSNATLRNANIQYGLLPMPKLNAEQDAYTTSVTVYWCSALAIPQTNVEKLDATCYAMEALAYYGQELVTPEYYDRTLKNKRFEDPDSEEMLDLIFRNRTFDPGAVFDFSSILSFYTDILLTGSNSHVATLESKQSIYQKAIDDFIEQMQQ